jgi:hypothetical protein
MWLLNIGRNGRVIRETLAVRHKIPKAGRRLGRCGLLAQKKDDRLVEELRAGLVSEMRFGGPMFPGENVHERMLVQIGR